MSLFDLIRHNDNIFTASELWSPFPSYPTFGGHLVSLSLLSAILFANAKPSSVHTYFLSPGEVGTPMNFEVKMLREGRTSKMVNVKGYQSNRLVVTSDCLMCNRADDSVIHSDCVEIYDDEYVKISEHFTNLWRMCKTNNSISEKKNPVKESGKMQGGSSLSALDAMVRKMEENYGKLDKYFSLYIGRSNGIKRQFKIVFHDKNRNFSVLMSFVSDLFLCNSSLAWVKHGHKNGMCNSDSKCDVVQNKMMCKVDNPDSAIDLDKVGKKSLDHKIYFHSNKSYDELIFVTKCQLLGEKKALFEGKLLSTEGTLVATVTQEGIITIKNND